MQINMTDRLVKKERLQKYECDLVWMPHKRAELNCDDILQLPNYQYFSINCQERVFSLFTQYHFQKKKECSLHNSLFAKKNKKNTTAQCVSPFWCSMQGHRCFQPATYLKQLSGDISLTSSSILKGTRSNGSSTHCECTCSIHCWHQTLWFSKHAMMNTETKTRYFLWQ